jgi:hypothetical protein
MPNIFLILIKLKEEIGFEVLPLLGLYGPFGAQNRKNKINKVSPLICSRYLPSYSPIQ